MAVPEMSAGQLVLLVATRKGLWLLHDAGGRREWRLEGPHFLGHDIHHAVLDPRDGRTLLVAARTGHLGPTLMRSTDLGAYWEEATRPPAFGPAQHGLPARTVNHTFWLTPGPASQPGVWYAGTSPQGLFRSDDGGCTWAPWSSLNDDATMRGWMGTVQDGTPDGPKLHSIVVDPDDPQHLYLGMSGGGVHETSDGGRTFQTLIDGLDVVEGFAPGDPTFCDPHCLRLCPSLPTRLYQQNHCGIYRLDRPSRQWLRIGRHMSAEVGDVGFPLVVHPRDADRLWVFPMDGTDVWPRTSPAGRPAAYCSSDGGASWQRQDVGFPVEQAWWTVKRQAMTIDHERAVGLYLGHAGGEVWGSTDEGGHWQCLVRHLPAIQAVEVAYSRA